MQKQTIVLYTIILGGPDPVMKAAFIMTLLLAGFITGINILRIIKFLK